jgi:hypothetical protein
MKTDSTLRIASLALAAARRGLFALFAGTVFLVLARCPCAAQTPCCVDISGVWNVDETVTIRIYIEGALEDEITQSSSGPTTISQDGCKFTFVTEVPDPSGSGQVFRLTRRGTITGNQAVFTGPAVARITGATCSNNEIEGVGPISSSGAGSRISFTTSAEVQCRSGGEEGEIIISGHATFTRSGQLSFPPEVEVTPSSLSVSNRFAADGSLLPGTNATFRAEVLDATGSVTYQWLRNGKAIARATNESLTITNVHCPDAGMYSVMVRHAGCSLASAGAALRVNGSTNATDKPPMLTVTSPGSTLTRVSNNVQTITGTAKDDRGVQGVYLQHGSGAFERVSTSSNWSVVVNLEPGTNALRFKAVDTCGHASPIVQRTVYFVVTSPLTVQTNGQGSITPVLNGQLLEVGRHYMLTATPAVGWLFSHWSGGVTSIDAKLTFEMKSNLTVTANFVPNPFIPTRGQFNGLFSEPDEVRVGHAGFFTLTLKEAGSYSASLHLGGKKISASGRFDLDGKATNWIVRTGTNALTVIWCLPFDGSDQITGSVSDGVWTSPLLGDRAVPGAATNVAAPGPYTLIFPGAPAAAALQAAGASLSGDPPEGDSHGTATVDAKGTISLKGDLAEKLKVTQKVPLSKNGHWPLHVSLYSGKGLLLGWINFTDEASSDFSGDVTWIKPPLPRAKHHAAGFTHTNLLVGSRYTAPTGALDRIVAITNGNVILSGGNLPQTLTNMVTLGLSNTVTNEGPLPLSLKFKLPSGQMSGSFTPPGASRAVTFSGVVLEKAGFASGYFLGTNASGRVRLQAAEVIP